MKKMLATSSALAISLACAPALASPSPLSMSMDRAGLTSGLPASICANIAASSVVNGGICQSIGTMSSSGQFLVAPYSVVDGALQAVRGFVSATAPGPGLSPMKCDGVTNDEPALAAIDAYAKSINFDTLLPSNRDCHLATGLAITTSHTHWRSFGGTTLSFDANMPTIYSGNQNGGLLFNTVDDTIIDGITFKGAGAPCNATTCGRVIFYDATNVFIRHDAWINFGVLANGQAATGGYMHGLLFNQGSNIYVDQSLFQNNSGDNLSFTGPGPLSNIWVTRSQMIGAGDSQLVCTVGGNGFHSVDNYMQAPAGNNAPALAFDRCQNVTARGDTISGGAQNIRVAAYPVNTSPSYINQNITIEGETVSGASNNAISIENAGTTQSGATVPGGGQVALLANHVSGPAGAAFNISDSDGVVAIGNTSVNPGTDHYHVEAFNSNETTGNIYIGGNTIVGGQYAVHQYASGGTLGLTTVGPNSISGTSFGPMAMIPANSLVSAANYGLNACRTYSAVLTATSPASGSTFVPGTVKACYRQDYDQTYVNIDVTITSNGNGGGILTVTLPNTAQLGGGLSGSEVATTFKGVKAQVYAGSNQMTIAYPDNSYAGANGAEFVVSGVYEGR